MSLIKWSPFFSEPFESMEKWFNDMQGVMPRSAGGIIPPVDVYETKEAVVVELPMAGVDPNKIELSIENGILSIKGTSERKTEMDEKNYYRQEVRYGSVFRQIALPTRVQEDKADATFENGILKVLLPKTSGAGGLIKVAVKKK